MQEKNESPLSLYYAYRMGQSDSTEEKMGEEGNVKQGIGSRRDNEIRIFF